MAVKKQYQVVIVGTGISAIAAAVSLRSRGIDDFIMVEKGSSIGGTWHANKYPGCACDIPFVLYTYSFLPYTNKEVFAASDDIEKYLNKVVDDFGLRDFMLFNTTVTSATFDEATNTWSISTNNSPLTANFLISATGQLSTPKLPQYVHTYLANPAPNGPTIMHSAEYDRTVPVAGQRIAIIGNGSTGVQLVESLQPLASSLLLFQRSPKWLLPKPFYNFPSLLLTPLHLLPFNLGNKLIRLWCYLTIESLHVAVSQPSFLQRLVQRYMKMKIVGANPNAVEMNCLPTYRPGCSRIIVHAGYPEIVTRPNVTVVNSTPSLTPSGKILADGKEYEVDVVVYATGFSVNDCGPSFPVTVDGETLTEVWKEGGRKWGGATLFGIVSGRIPNFFVMYGPHTNTILGSITFFSECAAEYVSKIVKGCIDGGIARVTVKEQAVAKYNSWVGSRFVGRPEMDSCSAWYKQGGGAVPVTNFPGGMSEYWWMTRKWRKDDYILE